MLTQLHLTFNKNDTKEKSKCAFSFEMIGHLITNLQHRYVQELLRDCCLTTAKVAVRLFWTQAEGC